MNPVYTFQAYQFDEASYTRNVREHESETEVDGTYSFNVTPDFEKQRPRLRQTMRVDKPPIIEPQTNPEVVHEHRETGHDSKYTPWTTELITTTRCETAKRTWRGFSTIRVMFIKFLVLLLTLGGDFDEVFFFGRLCRPLAHGGRRVHGRRYSGVEGGTREETIALSSIVPLPPNL